MVFAEREPRRFHRVLVLTPGLPSLLRPFDGQAVLGEVPQRAAAKVDSEILESVSERAEPTALTLARPQYHHR